MTGDLVLLRRHADDWHSDEGEDVLLYKDAELVWARWAVPTQSLGIVIEEGTGSVVWVLTAHGPGWVRTRDTETLVSQ